MTASAREWSGTYRGDIAGTPATLQLRAEDGALHGVIDAAGYRYELQANVSGATAHGTFRDPRTGGAGEAELALSGDDVDATVSFRSAASPREIRLSFTRDRTPAAAAPADDAERDPRLVGTWTRNDTLASGDATLVTQLILVVNPDGTFARSTGQTVGGGAGWGVSDGPAAGESGSWKTAGNIIHVGDGRAWQPYARYYLEGRTLMLTFADNSRELWNRG